MSRRLALICGALTVMCLGSAVAGTVSAFTAAGTTPQTVSVGTFTFSLSDPATGTPFSTSISGLAPGDAADRLVDLVNGGQIGYGSVALTLSASVSSALDSDAVNGLQLAIDLCSTAWSQAASTAAASCPGTLTPLTSSTAVATLKGAGPTYTTTLASLVSGGSDHLRLRYSLPAASSGTAGITSTLVQSFTAASAAGGAYH